MKTVTYTEFAKLRKVSQPMITKYVQSGVIKERSLIKVGARFRIRPELATDDLDRYFRSGIYENYPGNLDITANDELSKFDDLFKDLPDFDLP